MFRTSVNGIDNKGLSDIAQLILAEKTLIMAPDQAKQSRKIYYRVAQQR